MARRLVSEIGWSLDPTDPLRPYNQRFTTALLRHRLTPPWTPPEGSSDYKSGARWRPPPLHVEGHMQKAQARWFHQLLRRHSTLRDVMEIGFNTGHSAYLFLATCPEAKMVSFDLGDHDYVAVAKALIDRLFPGRHELITGDSTETVPRYVAEHEGRRFELCYVDGGHDYDVARADLFNCQALAAERALVVMDDLVPSEAFGKGPVRAWEEAATAGIIAEPLVVENGVPLVGSGPEAVTPGTFAWGVARYHPLAATSS